jgi:ketosteroid isomerase-like protein
VNATPLSAQLKQALEQRDVDALAPLLADDVRWGDDDHPRRCRGPKQVIEFFKDGMARGGKAQITELEQGTDGVLCRLKVTFSDGSERRTGADFWHVYMIRDGLINEIRRYDDRGSAAEAAGITA